MKPGDVVEVVAKFGYIGGGGWLHRSNVALVKVLSPEENLKAAAHIEAEVVEDMADEAFEFCVVMSETFPAQQNLAKAMGFTEPGQVIVSKAVLRPVEGGGE